MSFLDYLLWPPIMAVLLIGAGILLCAVLLFVKIPHKHILYGLLTFLSALLCILLLHFELVIYLEGELKLALVLSVIGGFIAAALYKSSK